MKSHDTLQDQIRELVLARIRTLPEDMALSIGREEFTRQQLLDHIEKNDSIGKEYTEMQIEFLQDMASGALYERP